MMADLGLACELGELIPTHVQDFEAKIASRLTQLGPCGKAQLEA